MINSLLGSALVWYMVNTGTQPAALPRYDISRMIIYRIIPPLHLRIIISAIHPHWVYCTVITKSLILRKTSQGSGPSHFIEQATSSFPKIGESILCYKNCSGRNSSNHPPVVKAFMWWQCNQYFGCCRCHLTGYLEQLSMQSLLGSSL